MEVANTKQILLKLKTIMLEKDIKKKELAEKLNISQAALNIYLDINFIDKDEIT